MGPDFYDGKKWQKKFATKVEKKTKNIYNLSQTQKKYKKRFSNTVSQKKFATKVAKKEKYI